MWGLSQGIRSINTYISGVYTIRTVYECNLWMWPCCAICIYMLWWRIYMLYHRFIFVWRMRMNCFRTWVLVVCIYTCIYIIRVYVCACIYVSSRCICVYMSCNLCIYICVFEGVGACLYIYIHMCVCMYNVCMCFLCMYWLNYNVDVYLCVFVFMSICYMIYIYMCVCISIYLYFACVCFYMLRVHCKVKIRK